jgi:hypothetical protein
METSKTAVELVAHPAPPNPPLVIALAIFIAGLLAPYLFLHTGSPSPFLGIACVALAIAGIIALVGAIDGQKRFRADRNCRLRARIAASGVTIFRAPPPSIGLFFPIDQIGNLHVTPGLLVIHTTQTHPSPGRHAIRFGKTAGDPEAIYAAIRAFQKPH